MTFLLSIVASCIGATLATDAWKLLNTATCVALGCGLAAGLGSGALLVAGDLPHPELGSFLVTLFAGAGAGALLALGAMMLTNDKPH